MGLSSSDVEATLSTSASVVSTVTSELIPSTVDVSVTAWISWTLPLNGTATKNDNQEEQRSYLSSRSPLLPLDSAPNDFENWTYWVTEAERSLKRDELDEVAYSAVYIIVGLIGFLCNFSIVFVILRYRSLRTTQNAVVVNLCFADILIEVTATGAVIGQLSLDFKPTTCYCIGFVMGIGPVVAVLTIAFISRSRHYAVTVGQPMQRQAAAAATTVASVIVIWVASVLLTAPILFQAIVVEACEPFGCCFFFQTGIVYGTLFTLLGYVVPNVIVIQYYIRILALVRSSRRRVQNASSVTTTQSPPKFHRQLTEVRLAMQFGSICFFLNLSYLPVLLLMWIETPTRLIKGHVRGAICMLYLIVPITNSIFYFLFNRKTRQEISRMLIGLTSGICVTDRTDSMATIQTIQ